MKIALLNLPLDSNYGGNLQRYALMKVLSRMGHDVIHLNLHFIPHVSTIYKIKWLLMQMKKKLCNDHSVTLSWKKSIEQNDILRCEVAKPFYDKYIPHTDPIFKKETLKKYDYYDAYIVGSDQVWRPSMAKSYGLKTYFIDYIPDTGNIRKVAYAVSMGVSEKEMSKEQIVTLRNLYNNFKAVSVRELISLKILDDYGWKNPKAEIALDPTLLLDKSDYVQIINENETSSIDGSLFCYILDPSSEKYAIIDDMAKEKGLKPFYQIGCSSSDSMSIPQWLRSIKDAEYIVTDSYHGLVFSLIFNKPVKVLMNKRRGNARFESLQELLHFDLYKDSFKWEAINDAIKKGQMESLSFLERSLN